LLQNSPHQVGFLIDKPGDVIDLNEKECEIPPANVSAVESQYIQDIIKLDNDLLIIIQPEKIFI
jgi:purine-binding chemotaxis protein CheW